MRRKKNAKMIEVVFKDGSLFISMSRFSMNVPISHLSYAGFDTDTMTHKWCTNNCNINVMMDDNNCWYEIEITVFLLNDPAVFCFITSEEMAQAIVSELMLL